ncbi:hypothetical protein QTP88_002655 [Uroleucon formosanum]
MVPSLYRHTGCIYQKPFEQVATYILYLARIRDEQTAERGKALAILSLGCHTHTEPITQRDSYVPGNVSRFHSNVKHVQKIIV